MNWKDIYSQKKLNEVATSVEGGVNVSGQIHTFVGRVGQKLDGLFAGPYHPDFGDIKDSLQNQLNDRYDKLDFSDINTPYLKTSFDDMGIDYKYDAKVEPDKSDFINDSEKNMKNIGIDYKFDEVGKEDKSNFINSSETNWEYINI